MNCYHCGDKISGPVVLHDNHSFCCHGCQSVYMLLAQNQMCSFYDNSERKLSKTPQIEKYSHLDNTQVADQYIQFRSSEKNIIQLRSPFIQCASCVYLLEKLHLLQPGILESRVNFSQQSIVIQYNPKVISLRQLIEWLTYIGYEPVLDHEKADTSLWKKIQKEYWIAIAVSGFCFANIMLLSFPEYLHLDTSEAKEMTALFRWINLFLAIPALFWGGRVFFRKTIQGFRAGTIPIDAPLVLSLLLTFSRSLYEILSETGAGYLDSMSGIIFFMLIGRYLQEATQHRLHFQRTYKSFFPISSLRLKNEKEEWIALNEIKENDILCIHSNEMIPCDSELLSEHALIDYAFVTGESQPQATKAGDILFAGGKELGGSIKIRALQKVEHSYLVNLWNNKTTERNKTQWTWVDQWANHFTLFLFGISILSFIYWYNIDWNRGLHAATTILIVACPCALLLSSAFTQGSALYQLSKLGVHAKNARVLDTLANVNCIAWDKTGTLTTKSVQVDWVKKPESIHLAAIHLLSKQSTHPISQALSQNTKRQEANLSFTQFTDIAGMGISATFNGNVYKIGSAEWVGTAPIENINAYIGFNQEIIGCIALHHPIRGGMKKALHALQKDFKQTILSGDPLKFSNEMLSIFPEGCHPFHGLSPIQKRSHIEQLKEQGNKVVMIGDGLNDAGALSAADVGIAVTEDAFGFSPSCDIIIESKQLHKIPQLIQYAQDQLKIVKWSFGISLLYNLIGLSIAVQGQMHPLIAAILMPSSSITIMGFTTLLAYWRRPR